MAEGQVPDGGDGSPRRCPRRPQPGTPPRRAGCSENRLKVALGIAVAEGIFVALEEDFSRVTVIVIAIPVILFWLLAGRTLDSPLGREISWILAMSQALAGRVPRSLPSSFPSSRSCSPAIFGAIAAYLLYHDRPDQPVATGAGEVARGRADRT